eukprot:3970723-Pyramimonas_sp.AAC.1
MEYVPVDKKSTFKVKKIVMPNMPGGVLHKTPKLSEPKPEFPDVRWLPRPSSGKPGSGSRGGPPVAIEPPEP